MKKEIPVMKKRDVDSFAWEWDKYRGDEEAERDLIIQPRLAPEFFKGKKILDAGCGNGRLINLSLKYEPRIAVGFDLSNSVLVAKKKVNHSDKANILQASIFQPPFKNGIFDIIFSIGVLHHTPDPKRAFKSLVDLVKPGGTIIIRVYGEYHPLHQLAIDILRKVTTKLPRDLFYRICWIQRPLGEMVFKVEKVSPKLARYIKIFFFIHDKKDPAYRQLAMFDWWTPKYMSFHSRKEVIKWFEECGFHDIVSFKESGVVVKGRKLTQSR